MESLKSARDELTPAVASLNDLTRSLTRIASKQASSLAETTATMREIQHTSVVAAAKAESVLQVAARADEFSGAGHAAIEASLGGLEEIRAQTETIIDRIAKLAESALQVGEIIESVKDLADQSNVLALNAAIEAAKAGEFGKGFGVVAREIRSLANQSIDSTGRVRQILGDIQAAIRGAASITEEGRGRMERSMGQIRASGENLRQVTGIVEESSQAARQIAASVRQQDAGIRQMQTAIGDFHTSMEQTVGGVNDAENAARNLGKIADRIVGIIDVFEKKQSASMVADGRK